MSFTPSGTAFRMCVCMFAWLLACLLAVWPYTINLKNECAVADPEGVPWVLWNPSFEGLPSKILCANVLRPETESHLILRASNTTTRFSSRSSNFYNFTPRIHQKRSQKVRNPKFSWGDMPPDPPSKHATRALIAYWNPPSQNSRSATAIGQHFTQIYNIYWT